LSQLFFGAGEADLKSFNFAEPARVLRLRRDSYSTPRMWPVYGRQAAPEHGGHMVTYPVLRRPDQRRVKIKDLHKNAYALSQGHRKRPRRGGEPWSEARVCSGQRIELPAGHDGGQGEGGLGQCEDFPTALSSCWRAIQQLMITPPLLAAFAERGQRTTSGLPGEKFPFSPIVNMCEIVSASLGICAEHNQERDDRTRSAEEADFLANAGRPHPS
jgi:hypothetical protein